MTQNTIQLPKRTGPAPQTGPMVPHEQLSQNAPSAIQEALWDRMRSLEGVRTGPSGISNPASRALHLEPRLAQGPPEAFLVGTEFAHLHGAADGSLHAMLPHPVEREAFEQGWAELHPAARAGIKPDTLVMIYGPRDEEELEVVWRLVEAGYGFAADSMEGRRKVSAGRNDTLRAPRDPLPADGAQKTIQEVRKEGRVDRDVGRGPGIGGRVQRDRVADALEQRDVGARVTHRRDLLEPLAVVPAPLLDETELVELVEVPADPARKVAVLDRHLGAGHGVESVSPLQHLRSEAPGHGAEQDPTAGRDQCGDRLFDAIDPRRGLELGPHFLRRHTREPLGRGVRHLTVRYLSGAEALLEPLDLGTPAHPFGQPQRDGRPAEQRSIKIEDDDRIGDGTHGHESSSRLAW